MIPPYRPRSPSRRPCLRDRIQTTRATKPRAAYSPTKPRSQRPRKNLVTSRNTIVAARMGPRYLDSDRAGCMPNRRSRSSRRSHTRQLRTPTSLSLPTRWVCQPAQSPKEDRRPDGHHRLTRPLNILSPSAAMCSEGTRTSCRDASHAPSLRGGRTVSRLIGRNAGIASPAPVMGVIENAASRRSRSGQVGGGPRKSGTSWSVACLCGRERS